MARPLPPPGPYPHPVVRQLDAVQQAVAEGLVEKVIVSGRHVDGRVELFTLTLKPPAPGEAAVVRLWLAYHRRYQNPSWSSFVAELAEARRMEVFRP